MGGSELQVKKLNLTDLEPNQRDNTSKPNPLGESNSGTGCAKPGFSDDLNASDTDKGDLHGLQEGLPIVINYTSDTEASDTGAEEFSVVVYKYYKNDVEAFNVVFSNAGEKAKKTMFWAAVSRLAAEVDNVHSDKVTDIVKFSSREAIKRLILRKMLSSCYIHMSKRDIVLILDNSGSMDWWEENVLCLANMAVEREDIVVYKAPNGRLLERLDRRNRDWREVEHAMEMRRLRNNVVVYVGDFDGSDEVYELAFKNSIIWICPEFRCVEPSEDTYLARMGCRLKYRHQFNGTFIRVKNLSEIVYWLLRIPIPIRKFVIDPYEREIRQSLSI